MKLPHANAQTQLQFINKSTVCPARQMKAHVDVHIYILGRQEDMGDEQTG
jgi:hypothetical protein